MFQPPQRNGGLQSKQSQVWRELLRKNTPQNVVLAEERDSTVGTGYVLRLRKVWAEEMAQQLEHFLLF